jgi:hypothetical protein
VLFAFKRWVRKIKHGCKRAAKQKVLKGWDPFWELGGMMDMLKWFFLSITTRKSVLFNPMKRLGFGFSNLGFAQPDSAHHLQLRIVGRLGNWVPQLYNTCLYQSGP